MFIVSQEAVSLHLLIIISHKNKDLVVFNQQNISYKPVFTLPQPGRAVHQKC